MIYSKDVKMATITSEQPTACVAIGSTTHGKWSYKAVVVYKAGTRKDGSACWLKDEIVHEATTAKKIERLAKQVAEERGLPLMPHVRHYASISYEVTQ